MHKRPEGKHHAGLWEFPGGKVEAGEVPEIALIREVQEELAIEIALDDLALAAEARSPQSSDESAIVITLYTCSRWIGDPDPQEGGVIGWFELNQIGGLPKPPLDKELLRQLIEKHAG